MKIGFIGTGNMASAIILGAVKSNFIPGKDIYLYDVFTQKAQELSNEIDGNACATAIEAIKEVDIVFLAVKPNMIEKVLADLKEEIVNQKKIVVSIAAGTTIDKLEKNLSKQTPIIRVMPNVNAMINLGAAAVTGNTASNSEQVHYIIDLFASIGKAWEVEEKDFSTFTALAGSSPAYAYLFIDSLARAGVKHGIAKDKALQYAAQAVLGSAQMILDSNENPWTLIDRVCSPGGTTVAGLLKLEEEAFLATVVKGIDATIARDEELSQNSK